MTSRPLLHDLLDTLGTSSRPALVQYDEDGRVELSGRVLARWIAKAANLFLEEGIGAGSVVALDLPVTWRALPFALGAWLQGAAVSTTSTRTPDVRVTDRPSEAEAGLVIAVPRGALALRWDGPLGAALDGAADVAAQPDLPVMPANPSPTDLAYADAAVRFGDLGEVIGTGTSGPVGIEPTSVWALVRESVAQWRAGGSVVLVTGLDPEARVRALRQEGV